MGLRIHLALCLVALAVVQGTKHVKLGDLEEAKTEDRWVEKDAAAAAPRRHGERKKDAGKAHHDKPVKLAQTTAAATCENWKMGTKMGDAAACTGDQQCITTDLEGTKGSECDAKNICTGMGTGTFSIPTGTCGIVPGLGQKAYCSATTPPGGDIPASVECKAITINAPPAPSNPDAGTPTPGTSPTPPTPAPPSSGPAECSTWSLEQMEEATKPCTEGNTKQCLTSEMTDDKGKLTTSNCDMHMVCSGLADNAYSIANGECGILDGRKMYCSSTTPPAGLIPDDVECKPVLMKGASGMGAAGEKVAGATGEATAGEKNAGQRVEWQMVGAFVTALAVVAARA